MSHIGMTISWRSDASKVILVVSKVNHCTLYATVKRNSTYATVLHIETVDSFNLVLKKT